MKTALIMAAAGALLISCGGGSKPCNNTCTTAAATQCSGTQLQTCTADANGCLAWSMPAACSAGQTCSAGAQRCIDEWTILVYMAADNTLEPAAIFNLSQMAQVGSTAGVNIVVEVDRSLKYSQDPIGNIPASATTKRLLVQKGSFQQISDLGDLDTSSPTVLADFIQWGLRTYPAANTALVLWDHGGAWHGFGEDDSQGDFMALASIQTALMTGLQQAGSAGFSILGFDACLMSSFEVMEVLKPYARYFLGSEETEPGAGWDYGKLQLIREAPATDPVTLAKAIVDGFITQNATAKNSTLALTDLTALSSLETAVGAIASQVTPNLGALATEIAQQRSLALEFGREPDPTASFYMVDIGELFARLGAADASHFGALRDQIASALNAAVLYKSDGTAAAAATGVSIYFPPTAAAYASAKNTYEALPNINSWRSFLEAYLAQAAAAVVPTFASHTATVTSGASGLTISAPLTTGASGAIGSASLDYGYYFPATPSAADEIDFYGDQPAQFDATTVTATWNKKVLQLTQGSTSAYAYLSLSIRGSGLAEADIPLAYLPSGGSDCAAANVGIATRQIIIDTSNNTVVQDLYYLNSQSSVAQLTPVAGSTFRPIVYFLVGTNGFTQTATSQGWGCVGSSLHADQAISIGFVTPSLSGTTVQEALLLSIQNAGGKGDAATALTTL